jgi:histidine triad (HIT) family protein
MTTCAFCRIARGEAEARIVWTSPDAVAFLPLNPATRGHTLIVPIHHVPDLWSVDERLGARLMAAVVKLGRAIDETLRPEGMNLITSAGAAASQTVFHLHLHLVPRWQGDRMGDIWPRGDPWSEAELDEVAGMIRAAAATL